MLYRCRRSHDQHKGGQGISTKLYTVEGGEQQAWHADTTGSFNGCIDCLAQVGRVIISSVTAVETVVVDNVTSKDCIQVVSTSWMNTVGTSCLLRKN